MANVMSDLNFLYLGQDAGGTQFFSLHNFADSSAQTVLQGLEAFETEGPSLCEQDQVYNGIECVSEFKQFYNDNHHEQLKLLIPPATGTFAASVWILVTELIGFIPERLLFF